MNTLRVGVSEDKNRRCRRTMEDAHAIHTPFAGVPEQGLFAVFDGHGGKSAAEYCSENFEKIVLERLDGGKHQPTEVLDAAFVYADTQLNPANNISSGCTAVAAMVLSNASPASDRMLYTANVGDARAVLCRNGVALRLSYDHKGSDTQEALRITEKGGFMMNNRVNGVLAVTRALGDSSMKEFILGNPYTTETRLCPEDEFLILACDGVWDVCDDQHAVNLVRDTDDPQKASEALVRHALDEFTTDNLTAMVIRFV